MTAAPATLSPPSPRPLTNAAKAASGASSVRTTLKPLRGWDPVVVTLSGARLVIDDAVEDYFSSEKAKMSADAVVR